MKTSERHRLKGNEVAQFVESTSQFVRERTSQVLAVGGVIAAVAAAVGLYALWQARTNEQAGALLAEATAVLASPLTTTDPAQAISYPTEEAKLEAALDKFLAAAERYPGTEAGLMARYQAASLLALLGRPEDSVTRFTEVAESAPQGSIYREMARLGKARAQAQAAQFDAAIGDLEALSNETGGAVPPDAALMELGRVYLQAGRAADAQRAFERLVEEYPESPFAPDAQREFDMLRVG